MIGDRTWDMTTHTLFHTTAPLTLFHGHMYFYIFQPHFQITSHVGIYYGRIINVFSSTKMSWKIKVPVVIIYNPTIEEKDYIYIYIYKMINWVLIPS